ncbi:hypothetical protein AVEN_135394-1 [Araneus ventricosus]|uniref:Uncharacterized protein n=1 Tax=Araneus ventricosus TaxID=182803 RepID=A0A4Y2KX10_ARAVE|nr:hypothetical protein AVEN_135394-1 [Araneus ventricosus]
MAWAAVCFNSETSLSLLRVKSNLKTTKRHLPVIWFPLLQFLVEQIWLSNMTIPSKHASKSTLQWVSSNMGSVLSGLARRPDLKVIENEWGKFTTLVYQNRKQYSSVEVL